MGVFLLKFLVVMSNDSLNYQLCILKYIEILGQISKVMQHVNQSLIDCFTYVHGLFIDILIEKHWIQHRTLP